MTPANQEKSRESALDGLKVFVIATAALALAVYAITS